MKVLFIVLNDTNFLEDILNAFLKLDVKGATILESEGMLKTVLKNEGLSYLFRGMFSPARPEDAHDSKTIFTVIKSDEKVKKVVEAVQNILEQSKKETTGFMFTLPVSDVYPMKKA
ncbi:MAG TPA: hypothetical protein GX742_00180 [Acholeplasmataceae bacterium]|nr:hypothetical protein [Acholeplasmataceae bacterium]